MNWSDINKFKKKEDHAHFFFQFLDNLIFFFRFIIVSRIPRALH